MTTPSERPQLIRAALLRKALADAGQRAALGRQLGLTGNDVLAVQHLASAGELTPGQLRSLLQLTSGGTTGLIHRLQRAGHLTRDSHRRDGRSAVLSLTPQTQTWASDAWAPLVDEIDSVIGELSVDKAHVVQRFLESVADAAERHAKRLAADADAMAHDALAVPLPAFWA
jgi:DNA-binding MarR family transcriptional regulator